MTDRQPMWDDIRRIADELELKMHLASMDARDRWRELQPQLAKLEKTIAHATERTGDALAKELDAVSAALRRLRDEITLRFN